MAQVAIPLVALGFMYILSNQKKEQPSLKEAFNKMHRPSTLPNMNKPVKNYPTLNRKELENNVNDYAGKKNTADNYYNPGNYETLQMSNKQQQQSFESLTGEKMRLGEITHNNQVPYFGSSVTQSTTGNNEGLLDTYTGSGTQDIAKQGQAPLFKPEKNMNWSHGMPNHVEFIQNRMKSNVSQKMNNTKPWEEIQVGPGLNKGYSNSGEGGFNSGMEARESWRPKTVDELRANTNPKVSYSGQVLGAYKPNKSGVHGRVEKNRPDTFYVNSEDRWFTTTGAEKGQTSRGKIALKPENRAFQTREYFGQSIPEGGGIYTEQNYQRSEKPQFKALNLGVATDKDGWDVKGKDMREVQQEGYRPLANARTLTNNKKNLALLQEVLKQWYCLLWTC